MRQRREPEIVYERVEPQYPVLYSDACLPTPFHISYCRIPNAYEPHLSRICCSPISVELEGSRIFARIVHPTMLLRKEFPKTVQQDQQNVIRIMSRLATPSSVSQGRNRTKNRDLILAYFTVGNKSSDLICLHKEYPL